MGDLKSKMPDLNELGSMAGKLFKDLKTSVTEIIDDYKQKHPSDAEKPAEPVKPKVKKAETDTKKD